MYLKLRQFCESRNPEMTGYLDTMQSVKKLWKIKLTTPLETMVDMKNSVAELKNKIAELVLTRDTKKEQLSKYMEENMEQKEARDKEIS